MPRAAARTPGGATRAPPPPPPPRPRPAARGARSGASPAPRRSAARGSRRRRVEAEQGRTAAWRRAPSPPRAFISSAPARRPPSAACPPPRFPDGPRAAPALRPGHPRGQAPREEPAPREPRRRLSGRGGWGARGKGPPQCAAPRAAPHAPPGPAWPERLSLCSRGRERAAPPGDRGVARGRHRVAVLRRRDGRLVPQSPRVEKPGSESRACGARRPGHLTLASAAAEVSSERRAENGPHECGWTRVLSPRLGGGSGTRACGREPDSLQPALAGSDSAKAREPDFGKAAVYRCLVLSPASLLPACSCPNSCWPRV